MPSPPWAAVIEKYGENRILTEPFVQKMMAGKFDQVPILTGFNSQEMIGFIESKTFFFSNNTHTKFSIFFKMLLKRNSKYKIRLRKKEDSYKLTNRQNSKHDHFSKL